MIISTVKYRKQAPPPSRKKKGSCLNKRIFVIINTSVDIFQHFWKEMVLRQDLEKKKNSTQVVFMKKCSLKHEPFFYGGGGGSCLLNFTVVSEH